MQFRKRKVVLFTFVCFLNHENKQYIIYQDILIQLIVFKAEDPQTYRIHRVKVKLSNRYTFAVYTTLIINLFGSK